MADAVDGEDAVQPIHRAAVTGDLARVVALIEEDPERLNAQVEERAIVETDTSTGQQCEVGGCTPLLLAAAAGHQAVVEGLLGMGADMEVRDVEGYRATHWACMVDRPQVLQSLATNGARLSARNGFRETPLMVALKSGAAACIRMLLRYDPESIELDARDVYGQTALHVAIIYGKDDTGVRLLLEGGADPTIRGMLHSTPRTPVELAALYDYHEYIPLLEAAEAEPQRALLLAKARMHHEVAHATAALPACLRRRLPTVRLREPERQEERGDEEARQLRAVARHVVEGGLIEDLVKELLAMLTPRWAWQEDKGDDDEEEGEE